jgi:hypothetical protein
MRSCGERIYSSTILDLGTWWRWIVCVTLRPLFSPGDRPQYIMVKRLGGPQSRYESCTLEKAPYLFQESSPYLSDSTHSYTYRTILITRVFWEKYTVCDVLPDFTSCVTWSMSHYSVWIVGFRATHYIITTRMSFTSRTMIVLYQSPPITWQENNDGKTVLNIQNMRILLLKMVV